MYIYIYICTYIYIYIYYTYYIYIYTLQTIFSIHCSVRDDGRRAPRRIAFWPLQKHQRGVPGKRLVGIFRGPLFRGPLIIISTYVLT